MASFLDYDFTSPLPHPGEILRQAYLAPHDMTAESLAKAMGLENRAFARARAKAAVLLSWIE